MAISGSENALQLAISESEGAGENDKFFFIAFVSSSRLFRLFVLALLTFAKGQAAATGGLAGLQQVVSIAFAACSGNAMTIKPAEIQLIICRVLIRTIEAIGVFIVVCLELVALYWDY